MPAPKHGSVKSWLLGSAVLLAAGGVWIVLNPTAAEVAKSALFSLFGVVTTPFILEFCVAVFGLLAVITYNNWRLKKEGDGWVYLAQTEAEDGEGETPPHRLDSVVVSEPVSESLLHKAEVGTAEGFLELGMATEALESLSTSGPPAERLMRVRAQLMAGRLAEAQQEMEDLLAEKGRGPWEEAEGRQVEALRTWVQASKEIASDSEAWLRRLDQTRP